MKAFIQLLKICFVVAILLAAWQAMMPATGMANELYQTVPTVPPATNTARPSSVPTRTATTVPTGVTLPTATEGLITATQPAIETATGTAPSISSSATTGQPILAAETIIPGTQSLAMTETADVLQVATQTANQAGSAGGGVILIVGLIGAGALLLVVVLGWLVWRGREKQG